jgi:hypothetical protein
MLRVRLAHGAAVVREGHNDPTTIPAPAINNPTSCGGQIESGVLNNSNPIQLVIPATIAHKAPCVVARFQ